MPQGVENGAISVYGVFTPHGQTFDDDFFDDHFMMSTPPGQTFDNDDFEDQFMVSTIWQDS